MSGMCVDVCQVARKPGSKQQGHIDSGLMSQSEVKPLAAGAEQALTLQKGQTVHLHLRVQAPFNVSSVIS